MTPPYGRKWGGTKERLDKVKEESEKVGLKLNIQETKIMTSSPISSWQIDGETMETVTDFIFLDTKVTAGGDCSHEINTLAPWKKSYDQPRQNIKKQRHYFAEKGQCAEYIMRTPGLDEQVGIKIAGRNINNLRYADDTTLMAEN